MEVVSAVMALSALLNAEASSPMRNTNPKPHPKLPPSATVGYKLSARSMAKAWLSAQV